MSTVNVVVVDTETGQTVFASSYYSVKQLKLKWDVGFRIESVTYEVKE